jgi:hypothetical protein
MTYRTARDRVTAALYVDPRGPYVSMLGVDAWTKDRDAKRYDGTAPVVAHPDCGPWSKLRHLCTKQDPECGPRAVEQVRQWGGILEHPAHSLLWDHCRLPIPHGLPDEYGGRSYLVHQVKWGHSCTKPTWLYVMGVDHDRVRREIWFPPFPHAEPTHMVCTGPGIKKRLPVATKLAKRLTPPLFAAWLVNLASTVRMKEVA